MGIHVQVQVQATVRECIFWVYEFAWARAWLTRLVRFVAVLAFEIVDSGAGVLLLTGVGMLKAVVILLCATNDVLGEMPIGSLAVFFGFVRPSPVKTGREAGEFLVACRGELPCRRRCKSTTLLVSTNTAIKDRTSRVVSIHRTRLRFGLPPTEQFGPTLISGLRSRYDKCVLRVLRPLYGESPRLSLGSGSAASRC